MTKLISALRTFPASYSPVSHRDHWRYLSHPQTIRSVSVPFPPPNPAPHTTTLSVWTDTRIYFLTASDIFIRRGGLNIDEISHPATTAEAKLLLFFLLLFVTVIIVISVYGIRAGLVCHAGKVFPELINNFLRHFQRIRRQCRIPFQQIRQCFQ